MGVHDWTPIAAHHNDFFGRDAVLNKLNHYLATWELSDPQPLTTTATSHIYVVTLKDTKVILKLLTPVGREEHYGAIALRWFNGQGAVRLLRDDAYAHLLEYVDGEDLVALVTKGKDEEATRIIGDVLNQLHSASNDTLPDGLIPLKRWFRSLFQRAKKEKSSDSIFVRGASTAEALLASQTEVRVLHGDIHHENIRHHAQRGWLAFDPKGLVGERTYDAANTLCNPYDMPTLVENEARLLTNAVILSQKLRIDLTRILSFTFAYVCLSASWCIDRDHNATHALRIAEIVEPHVKQ